MTDEAFAAHLKTKKGYSACVLDSTCTEQVNEQYLFGGVVWAATGGRLIKHRVSRQLKKECAIFW